MKTYQIATMLMYGLFAAAAKKGFMRCRSY